MRVRQARQARAWTLAELGRRTGYSAAQVSRYERGLAPLTDVTVIRRFAEALGLPVEDFGLVPVPAVPGPRPASVRSIPWLPRPIVGREEPREGENVRRRRLLANLAATASLPFVGRGAAGARAPASGDLLVARVRDAMLGLDTAPAATTTAWVRGALAVALSDFHTGRYGALAERLPRLLAAGHALADESASVEHQALLAEIYVLTTRMLIKLDDPQLGWMAADRARIIAHTGNSALVAAEASRNLAVLARKAGWHEQAMRIALDAADRLTLRGPSPRLTAERGLLIQSAAYTAARAGDRDGMRELTDEAAAIAERLGGVMLRDHGGGFGTATVALHRISAENAAGDPGAAIATARAIAPASLPTVERRCRYFTDVATAYAHWGRRDQSLHALLNAERCSPEETHTRPAVRALVSGLLLGGRTTPELRALATRCAIA
ncbi:helix-turn-helix domain-containing protein [Streptomyces sp. SID3343]|nr:helix-turn-helix transcriptional regulator [Streptomyces sp. SID3343]MYV97044.1 helix-turn-helix domain-containing protein [Streptomyces sp. SID3343]